MQNRSITAGTPFGIGLLSEVAPLPARMGTTYPTTTPTNKQVQTVDHGEYFVDPELDEVSDTQDD
jgi:hypothetical protein